MAVSSNDMNLAQQIKEVGNKLAELPTEVEVLLPILDRVGVLLSQVEQAPSQPLLDACSVVMKPLVEEPLLKHFHNDVKVFVAACLCEVTRIMAPESAYGDPEMKEMFQLIVSSFKDLFDMSSRSYSKRISILDNVARVRSAVLMLDLECDSLIVEMFQNFLGSIRDYHPESVFTYMETIMTLVIEESDEVSQELLTPILGVLKKNNEDTQTISRKLGEKVLETCAVKVKPYLVEALIFLGRPLSQYDAIVAHICEEAGLVEHHDDDGSVHNLVNANSNEANKTLKDILVEKNTTLGNGNPSDDDLALKISEFVTKAKKSKRSFSRELPQNKKYGEDLVGSKIRVWWEDDHEFYEGVIASFDPHNKKHKVLYDDGDVEILDMKNENWEFVKDETMKLHIEYGEDLVGSKIKVWWEDDHEFYEGVIASFDADNKKHKVLYDDGEVEILDMKNEKWEFVKDETMENKQGVMESSEDVSAKTGKSKKGGSKFLPDNDDSVMPKSKSMSNRGKSTSKSKRKAPQVGSKSDRKRKNRS